MAETPASLGRLLARASFGARPGELPSRRPADGAAEAWLSRQLAPARDRELERRLGSFSSLDLEPGEMLADMDLPDRQMRERGEVSEATKRMFKQRTREVTADLVGARIVRAVHGTNQLREVMIDFWSNHFSVFARKGPISGVLPHYQRTVLERYALGRFPDLLLAVARSPAMLFYLDNWVSMAPRPFLRARPRLRESGINENYARELMELHTLGIHGGYTQDDVREVARVFTGWTLESRREPSFVFREMLHDPGPKVVMGERVPGSGVEEGEGVLARLARHPSTALHLARKLATRFVSDDPPPPLVERAARRFLETDGDIREVLGVILRSPELADPSQRKLKTPLRYVTSALRATGGEAVGSPPLVFALSRLGEVPYFARTPAGYPETSDAWIDPAAILERIGLAFALARGRVPGARLGSQWPAGLPTVASRLRGSEATALTLASPEFQWT